MQILVPKLQHFLSRAADSVLPPRCIVSGDFVESQGMVTPVAWASLDFIAAPFCERCGVPFDFEVENGVSCTDCLKSAPPYKTARSVLRYNEASRGMILGFKHADKTHTAKTYAAWLARAGEKALAEADYLMPVPLHYWRMVSRRYNQSALIAGFLSRQSGVEVLFDGLERVRITPSQGRLNMKARQSNVSKAFIVSPNHINEIQNKTIVLVDDVYTTGSTVKECTRTLLKAGAHAVHVLTLARTTRSFFY